MEAEYAALAEVTKEVVYTKRLLTHMGFKDYVKAPIAMLCDNQSAIELTKNATFHNRSKHIDIGYHYTREIAERGEIKVTYVKCEDMVVDIFTKPLPRLKHLKHINVHLITLSMQTVNCHLWSNSTITLAWLRESPTTWKTYVANRVSEIQTTVPQAAWHHISGKENPADLASRGITPPDLSASSLWLHGPSFLTISSEPWQTTDVSQNVDCPEKRSASCFAIHTRKQPPPAESELLVGYSSLKKLLQTTAWCLHFFNQLRRKRTPTSVQCSLMQALTSAQLEDALKHWIKSVQLLHFSTETQALKGKRPCASLLSLLRPREHANNPFLDPDEVLRVGGRLKHSLLQADEKYPMILPRESHLTQLLLKDAHEKTLHGGTQFMLNYFRQRFWIVRGRQLVKTFILKCLQCWKLGASPSTQLMRDLPFKRVQQFRAFLHTSVDYAGPITGPIVYPKVEVPSHIRGTHKELRALFGQAVAQSDQLV
ncbi:uncharacterized protein LOC143305453 [Osmia lignaria lignaria]|uniref:uncharacterized protein LOC143305453 n=1 Tax=Osmia lignaria lignaria TaxID=1437193 RepID=UPI00402BA854